MHKTNYYALARVTMHQREYTVVIRCGVRGLVLHTMYYSDELREEQAFRTEEKLVARKELTLAEALIDNLATDFDPSQYHDTYRSQLYQLIQAKIKGNKFVSAPAVEAAPVIDIMEALQRSLARKKPPQVAGPTRRPGTAVPKKTVPVRQKSAAKG